MKSVIRLFLIVALVAFASTALAVPALQLDISNGIYDMETETVYSTTPIYELYALIDDTFAFDQVFYLSAAIDEPREFGSFKIGSNTISFTDMEFGIPVGLPPHGVYPASYIAFDFTFANTSPSIVPPFPVVEYNVADDPGGIDTDLGGATKFLTAVAFDIDITELAPGRTVFFDLYTYDSFGRITKAPFSHNAGSSTVPVPEPSTLLLLGAGIVGLAAYRRKKH